jgi:hypothetical protein
MAEPSYYDQEQKYQERIYQLVYGAFSRMVRMPQNVFNLAHSPLFPLSALA